MRDRHDTTNRARVLPMPLGVGGALCAAALCVFGLAATWFVAALVPAAHARDAVALYDFTRLDGPRVDALASHLLQLLDPPLYTAWGVLIVAVALVRRRLRLALAIALVLALAPLSAELLKPLLAHPHAPAGARDIVAASWPSGHATAAMTLALCFVLVVPRRARPTAAALGTLFVLAVGCSLLLLAWHMPSDVVGGYLLAALWAALAVAALRASERRARHSGVSVSGGAAPAVGTRLQGALVSAALAGTIVVTGAVVLVRRLDASADYPLGRVSPLLAIVGAFVFAAVVCAMLAAVVWWYRMRQLHRAPHRVSASRWER